MVKVEQLLNKLEQHADELQNTTDVGVSVKLFKKCKKMVTKCETKLELLENMMDGDDGKDGEADDVGQIINRLNEINELLDSDIDVGESVNLFLESKRLQRAYHNKMKNGTLNCVNKC